MSNQNLQLPISYVDTANIHTWILDVFDSPFGLPCICGDQTGTQELHIVRPYIIRVCQLEDNPCYVEIDFHLGTAQGIHHYQPNLSGFSFDTTDGQNGTWHQLVPDYEHSAHNPSPNNITLSGTDRVDASWAFATFDPANPAHIGADPCLANYQNLGIPVHKFVFDMCDHVDGFLSETDIAFRLTFDKRSPSANTPLSCGVTFING